MAEEIKTENKNQKGGETQNKPTIKTFKTTDTFKFPNPKQNLIINYDNPNRKQRIVCTDACDNHNMHFFDGNPDTDKCPNCGSNKIRRVKETEQFCKTKTCYYHGTLEVCPICGKPTDSTNNSKYKPFSPPIGVLGQIAPSRMGPATEDEIPLNHPYWDRS